MKIQDYMTGYLTDKIKYMELQIKFRDIIIDTLRAGLPVETMMSKLVELRDIKSDKFPVEDFDALVLLHEKKTRTNKET